MHYVAVRQHPAVFRNPAPDKPWYIHDVSGGITIDGIQVVSDNAVAAGSSSIAVVVANSNNVVFRHAVLKAGAGAPGTSGEDGTEGSMGPQVAVPQAGTPATCTSPPAAQAGGAWNTVNACGSQGGAGGMGGCGGKKGTGGKGGGASVGLLLFNSPTTLDDTTVHASIGGHGQNGGRGAWGGWGSLGAPGGADVSGVIGGCGSGGPSVAIVYTGPGPVRQNTVQLEFSIGGGLGYGVGEVCAVAAPNGHNGQSTDILDVTQ